MKIFFSFHVLLFFEKVSVGLQMISTYRNYKDAKLAVELLAKMRMLFCLNFFGR